MSMITAHGTLVLSNTKPLATTAADGTFVLTLHAYDRQRSGSTSRGNVESWRVIYTGAPAKDFWQHAKGFLVPGAAINLSVQRLRAVNVGRFGGAEFEAHATHIVLTPNLSTHHTNPPTTSAHVCPA